MRCAIVGILVLLSGRLQLAAQLHLNPEELSIVAASQGIADRDFIFCQSLTEGQFRILQQSLPAVGLHVSRLRPYPSDDGLRLAVLWRRSDFESRVELNLVKDTMSERIESLQNESWSIEHCSCYPESLEGNQPLLHAAVFSRLREGQPEVRWYIETTESEHNVLLETLKQDGFLPRVIQPQRASDGRIVINGVWEKAADRWRYQWGRQDVYEKVAEDERGKSLQLDIAVLPWPTESALVRLEQFRKNHDARIREDATQLDACFWRGFNSFWLEHHAEAMSDFSRVIDQQPEFRDGAAFGYRAMLRAREGLSEEVTEDLRELRQRSGDNAQSVYFEIGAAAAAGQFDAAKALFESVRDENDQVSNRVLRWLTSLRGLAAAAALAPAGETRDALTEFLVKQLDTVTFPYYFADRDADLELDLLSNHPAVSAYRYRARIDRYLCGVWRQTPEILDSRTLAPGSLDEHAVRCRELSDSGWSPVSVSVVVTTPGQPPVATSIWQRPTPAEIIAARSAREEAIEQVKSGNIEGAITRLREIVATRSKFYEEDHPDVLTAEQDLAIALAWRSDADESVKLFKQIGQKLDGRPDLGHASDRRRTWAMNLDKVLRDQALKSRKAGEWEIALNYIVMLLEHRQWELLFDDPRVLDAQRWADQLRRILELPVDVQSELRVIAQRLLQSRSMGERISVLHSQSVVEHFEVRLGADAILTCEARLEHVKALMRSGNTLESRQILARLVQEMEGNELAKSSELGLALAYEGIINAQRGELRTAIEAFTRSAEILKLYDADRRGDYRDVLNQLANALNSELANLRREGRWAEARASVERLIDLQRDRNEHPNNDVSELNWQLNDLLRAEQLSNEDRQTLASLEAAGSSLPANNSLIPLEQYRRAIAECQRLLGSGSWMETQARLRFAAELKSGGNLNDAVAELRIAVPAINTILTQQHPAARAAAMRLVTLLGEIADSMAEDGNFPRAIETQREITAWWEQLESEEHWRVVESRVRQEDLERLAQLSPEQLQRIAIARQQILAAADHAKGSDFVRSLQDASDALAVFRELIGDDHRESLEAVAWMIQSYYQLGNYARVEQLLRPDLAHYGRRYGDQSPKLANRLRDLGVVYSSRGDARRAVPPLSRAWEIRTQCLGEDDDQTEEVAKELIGALESLASDAFQQNDLQECRQLRALRLKVVTQLHGASSWDAVLERKNLQWTEQMEQIDPLTMTQIREAASRLETDVPRLNAAGRPQEALEELSKIMTVFESNQGAADHLLAETMYWKGQLLVGLNRSDDALKAYAEARQAFQTAFGRAPPRLADVLQSQAELELTRKNPDAAEAHVSEACRILSETVGEKDPAYAGALQNLSTFFERIAEQSAQAEDFITAAAKLNEAIDLTVFKVQNDNDYRVINLRLKRDQYQFMATATDEQRMKIAVLRDRTSEAWAEFNAQRFKEAIQTFDDVQKLSLETFGGESSQFATALFQAARALHAAGNYDEAEHRYRQTLELRRRILGNEHVDVAYCLNHLGWLLQQSEQPKAAQLLHEEAISILRKVFGEQHLEYAYAISNLGLSLQKQSQLTQAEPLLSQALTIYRQVQGEKHPDYASGLNNLAVLHMSQERLAQAESEMREAIGILRAWPTTRGLDLAQYLTNLGDILQRRQRHVDSESSLAEALTLLKSILGPDHPQTLQTATMLARSVKSIQSEGIDRSSTPLVELVAEVKLGDSSAEIPEGRQAGTITVSGKNQLGRYFEAIGDHDRAVEVFRQVLETRISQLGTNNPRTAEARNELILSLDRRAKFKLESDQLTAASHDWKEAESLMVVALGPDAWQLSKLRIPLKELDGESALTIEQQSQLKQARQAFEQGRRLKEQGQHEQALDIWRSALKTVEHLLGKDFTLCTTLHGWIGGTLRDLKRYAQAEVHLKLALATIERLHGRNHEYTARRLLSLARLHFQAQDYAAAVKEASETLEILERLELTGAEIYSDTLLLQGGIFHWMGDNQRAEAVFQQAAPVIAKRYGEDSSEYADLMGNLGSVYRENKEFVKAIEACRQSWNISRRVLGPGDPDTLLKLRELGSTYSRADELDQAETILRQAIGEARQAVGDDHELVTRLRRDMVDLLATVAEKRFGQRRFADEVRVRTEIAAIQTLLFPQGDWRIANGSAYLARAKRLALMNESQVLEYLNALQKTSELRRLEKEGNYAAALLLMEQALGVYERLLGRDSRDYALELDFHGRLLRLADNLQAADAAVEEAQKIMREVLTPAHRSTLNAIGHLALIRELRGNISDALQLRREVVTLAESAWSDSSPELATAREKLIQTLESQSTTARNIGNFATAVDLLTSAIQVAVQRYGEHHYRVIDLELERSMIRRESTMIPDDRDRLVSLRQQVAQVAQFRSQQRYEEEDQLATQLAQQFMDLTGDASREPIGLMSRAGGACYLAGNLSNAVDRFARARELAERILGRNHPDLASIISDQARLQAALGTPDDALRLHEESIAILTAAGVGTADQLKTGRNEVINQLETRIETCRTLQQYSEARTLQKNLTHFVATQLGSGHWRARDSAKQSTMWERVVGFSPHDQARFAAADKLSTEATRIADKDLLQSVTLQRQALREYESLLGDDLPEIALRYLNLGVRDYNSGDVPQAEIDLRRALVVGEKAWGHSHPHYAATLGNLGPVVSRLGGHDSGALYAEALEIFRQLGEKDEEAYSTLLINAGMDRLAVGDADAARPLLYEGVGRVRAISGEDSVHYAIALSAVAMSLAAQSELPEAERILRQALAIIVNKQAEARLHYPSTLKALSKVVLAQGRIEEARSLIIELLEAERQLAGTPDRIIAATLAELATLHLQLCEFSAARSALDEAFAIYEVILTRAAMNESQQMGLAAELDSALAIWMTLVVRTSMSAEHAYEPVLRWKGSGFSQQRRVQRARIQSELFPLLDELELVASRIAALETSIFKPEDRIAHSVELAAAARRRDELDAELSRRSAGYRNQKIQLKPRLPDIWKLLQPKEVLIDIKRFNMVDEGSEQSGRLIAFVIHGGQPANPITMVDFGQGSDAEAEILVSRWLKSYGQSQDAKQASFTLSHMLWSHLTLGDATTILIAPEGALARFPFAALPDPTVDHFLIERFDMAVVPASSMLPDLLAPVASDHSENPALVLVGGVEFGQPTGSLMAARRGLRSSEDAPFDQLPNSAFEVARIHQTFRTAFGENLNVQLLDKANATEARFRNAVPGATFIHLAVHGFQSLQRPTKANAVGPTSLHATDLNTQDRSAGVHPGMLCGVALAGANASPTLEDSLTDDGLLTGLEVANLDLRASRLVVLSACETGVGQEAAGEGMLTLQRAFAVAGARSTVSTLWSVYDEPSSVLMAEFYHTMLSTDDKQLQPMAALCAAQRAMLNRYDIKAGRLRGATISDPADSPSGSQRLPPVYWAGFVLSGAWR